jgi:hypothetical protein
MKLIVTRLDERRYASVIARDDGVRFHVQGVAHMFAIPHDLAHFAIEKALGLRSGFWGSVAGGAVFKTMRYLDGRRRPHAAERSRTLLKANSRRLNEAEVLVRIFNDAFEQGHGPKSPVLLARLQARRNSRGIKADAFGEADIAAAYQAYRDMLARWNKVPVRGTLELVWQSGALS